MKRKYVEILNSYIKFRTSGLDLRARFGFIVWLYVNW